MTEVFANEFLAALAEGLNDNETDITLSEAPPAALATGTWRLRIGTLPSPSDLEPAFELCLVDGTLTSGSTVTVTRGAEGTAAVSWSDGTPVAAVLTAGGLAGLSGDTPTLAEVLLEGNDPGGTALAAADDGSEFGASLLLGAAGGAVHGKVSIRTDGSTGDPNYVLTADGSGNATWAPAPTPAADTLAAVLAAGNDANAGTIVNIDRFDGVIGALDSPPHFQANGGLPGAILYAGDDDTGGVGARLQITSGVTGVHGVWAVTTSGTAFELLAGTADPSAGGGVAASLLSTYRRDNAGTGELWFKTGAGDTAWTQVV